MKTTVTRFIVKKDAAYLNIVAWGEIQDAMHYKDKNVKLKPGEKLVMLSITYEEMNYETDT